MVETPDFARVHVAVESLPTAVDVAVLRDVVDAAVWVYESSESDHRVGRSAVSLADLGMATAEEAAEWAARMRSCSVEVMWSPGDWGLISLVQTAACRKGTLYVTLPSLYDEFDWDDMFDVLDGRRRSHWHGEL